MKSLYNPAAYRGGHRVVASQYATVMTFLSGSEYKFVIEFYDDCGHMYAYKFSSGIGWPTEQSALDHAFELVGAIDRRVSA